MVATAAHTRPVIDRAACPSRRGHGTRHHRYANGCTCPDGLRDARAQRYRVERKQPLRDRFVSGVGAARRLQACSLLGHTSREMSARSGIDASELGKLRAGKTWIAPATHESVRRLCDALHREPAPVDPPGAGGRSSRHARARAHAVRCGWLPLGVWIDVDDPDETPDVSALRVGPPGRVATDDLLWLRDRAGLDNAAIARRVGMTEDAVERRFQRHDARQAVLQAPSDPVAVGPCDVNITCAGSPAGADREEGTAA